MLYWGQVHINKLLLIQALTFLRTTRVGIHAEAFSFGEVVAKRDSHILIILILANLGVYVGKIDSGSNQFGTEQVPPIDG